MDMTEKNGQPSMEEILASIRRIIAEEPADAISLDLKTRSAPLADGLDTDEAGDFELPSIFRGATNGASEKSNGGKLLDALRATAQSVSKPSAPVDFPVPASLGLANALPPAQAAANFQSLSSLALKPAKIEPSASELFGRSTVVAQTPAEPMVKIEVAPSVIVEEPVVRVMAPFRDTHFSRMTSGVMQTPAHEPEPVVLAPVVQAVAPPPPAAPSFATLAFNSATPPPLSVQPAAPAPAAPVNGAPLGGAGIEDATAELLRPMLRQWLSENMPRMVEKALHIEVAESVKPKT